MHRLLLAAASTWRSPEKLLLSRLSTMRLRRPWLYIAGRLPFSLLLSRVTIWSCVNTFPYPQFVGRGPEIALLDMFLHEEMYMCEGLQTMSHTYSRAL